MIFIDGRGYVDGYGKRCANQFECYEQDFHLNKRENQYRENKVNDHYK